MKLAELLISTAFLVNLVSPQENGGAELAPSLLECYNNTLLEIRDNRLPATLNTLIALIRKAEEGNPEVDAGTLSIQLLQRFRQDGIQKVQPTEDDEEESYLPLGPELYSNQILLKYLTPGDAETFNNDSLSTLERCSLHSLISNTMETVERGDEEVVCNNLFKSKLKRTAEDKTARADPGISECPIESGVVLTNAGPVKIGMVLAGISAGLVQNNVNTNNGTLDSRYGSTIVAQLSQAALYAIGDNVQIGVRGGWNSTVVPKYYFVNEDWANSEVTDAEIRGGIDGFNLATTAHNWQNSVPDIKISQILDLYYSPRGLLDYNLRACNRGLFTDQESIYYLLLTQTRRYNYVLKPLLPNNPSDDFMYKQAQIAVNSFTSYTPSLNFVDCIDGEDPVVERVATDLFIFVDSSWNFRDISTLLNAILDNIDINQYESSFTILNGDGNVAVEKSRTILDFYSKFDESSYNNQPTDFDYVKAYTVAQDLIRGKLDDKSNTGGQSTIILLAPHSAAPTSAEKQFAREQREKNKLLLPDMEILVVSQLSGGELEDFVASRGNIVYFGDDSVESEVAQASSIVLNLIANIPRSVVNPECGSTFESTVPTAFTSFQYVEQEGRNFHKISPNYFYPGTSGKLKIGATVYGTLYVCVSRDPETCSDLETGEISIDLSCDGTSLQFCKPIYLSVEGLYSNTFCFEEGCKYPDSIKYSISLESVGCASDD